MTAEDSSGNAANLLELVRALHRELNPAGEARASVTLDSSLDRDLALDSLSRVELLARLERAYGVALPGDVLAHADTPRDLLRALAAANPERTPVGHAPVEPVAAEAESAPDSTLTLVDALRWHVQRHPERTHIHLHEEGGDVRSISYRSVLDGATSVAAGLIAQGFEPGRAAAIMLPTGEAYFWTFFGIQLAGGIPVPIYPPARVNQIEDHFRRHAGILENARVSHLVTFERVKQVARLLTSQVEGLRRIVTVDELVGSGRLTETPVIGADDIAFLQYTSGSTGNPKGVVLTHDNVVQSLRSMARALEVSPADVFVSWLPLYHDMGLIGAWMGALYYGFPLVLMSPLDFLTRPQRWLEAIHRHGGTMSGGPNFAFELCLRRLADEDIAGLDLSSWRLAFNGAEPVSPQTLRAFERRFAANGLAPGALTPVYGLAEATLGVAFTPCGRGPRYDVVDRERMTRAGRAEPAGTHGGDTLTFVSAGVPIPGFEVRIVDASARELPERGEGRVEFIGPSTTGGYYRNAEATRELFDGEWLDSGDRGYVAGGELYVTGRTKDVIIRAGRNIYPYELEQAVAEIDGVRRGCVAVFGVAGAGGTEQLVVVAETRVTDTAARDAIRAAVVQAGADLLDAAPDEVVLVAPHVVLKTSSGKIRRSAVRELYERGRLARADRAVWMQVLRLSVAAMAPQCRATLRRLGALAHALRVWATFVAAAVCAWFAVVLARDPGTAWRRAGSIARVLLRQAGNPVTVGGVEHLPLDGGLVVVANHSSYLDGLVLVASLPRPASFAVKSELERHFVSRLFLSRLGCRFVDRFDRSRGASDTDALADVPRAGGVLGVFPEGTFHRMPGLLPFHMGAFIAATGSGAAVVPVVIRGTRSALRGDELFPRPGAVRVEVRPPLCPAPAAASEWEAAVSLRDAARAVILERCGEPDMADRRPLLEREA